MPRLPSGANNGGKDLQTAKNRRMSNKLFKNEVIQPLLTDYYQISMAYAYWHNEKMNDFAVFDLFFRKNPFKGEYTIFGGLQQCIEYLKEFKFSEDDINFLKSILPSTTDPKFFEYLKTLTTKEVTLYAVAEGSVVFPKTPIIRIEGPLAVVQLLETTLLNLVNYASLIATNAARFRKAAGDNKVLLEFGLRRAQGPDGALSASRYCYMGGFDGTSNVLAAKEFGIPTKGTHAHAFVSSFDINEVNLKMKLLDLNDNISKEFLPVVNQKLLDVADAFKISLDQTSQGELKAFAAYANAFPTTFVALVDTYNVLKSGVLNFIAVTLALNDFGYKSIGIRIDSGDLAYLSLEVRKLLKQAAERFNIGWLEHLTITASNDINEETLTSLQQQGHSIDAYGIGTHLVTCQKQPALGCVYKLVELNGIPRIKLSEVVSKVTIPGKKDIYRLYNSDGTALLDLMTNSFESAPIAGERVLCRHPYDESKRAYVKPTVVEPLLKLYWKDGEIQTPLNSLEEARANVKQSLKTLRPDHLRSLNPTPYKVSVTEGLYSYFHELWLKCSPITDLS
nr:nicotinate phosphoribosyltransferase isoform X1 [Hydra vulgaris]